MNLSQELSLLTVLCKDIKAVNLMVTSDSEGSQTFITFHKGSLNYSVFHSAHGGFARVKLK